MDLVPPNECKFSSVGLDHGVHLLQFQISGGVEELMVALKLFNFFQINKILVKNLSSTF